MNDGWKEILTKELRDLGKLVVLGTGNALKADDAAGLLVAGLLDNNLNRYQKSKIKVLRAYEVIDSYLIKIKRLKPTHLVIIDALDFKHRPGSIQVTKIDIKKKKKKRIRGEFYDFLERLAQETSCKLIFIGIQPEVLEFGHPVTPAIKEAGRKLAEFLKLRVPGKPVS